ncbi:MAG: transcription-repair coupling factor [Paludibacteraceae bacterium]|nr:transcription-repair coupling factor [Paludibacteraceae bacterium]
MTIEEWSDRMSALSEGGALRSLLRARGGRHVLLTGLYASARGLVLHALGGRQVVVMTSQDEAMYLFSDLRTLGADALYFPTSYRKRHRSPSSGHSAGAVDEALMVQRTEVLAALGAGREVVVVTYPEALAEPTPAPMALSESMLRVRKGEQRRIDELSEELTGMGFEHVDFVFQPGQFAVRGGIVDVYSYSHDDPYRFDFFGDEVDSIRVFDIETQLSKERVEEAVLTGSVAAGEDGAEGECTLTSYLTDETVWVSDDWSMVRYKLDSLPAPHLLDIVQKRGTIEFRQKSTYFKEQSVIAYDTLPQPAFNKNFDLLCEDLRARVREGYTLYILADQAKQTDRLRAIFDEIGGEVIPFTAVEKTLHEGFVDRAGKVCCYTDHQLFERYHRVTLLSENARRGKAVVTLREINQLQLGDYVVHSDHGIGRFGGLVTTTVNGRPQEMVKIIFRDGDNIFVSIHNLQRISKYKGKEGSEPTISRLGSGAWERLKERTKDRVKDIARDLIRLYATRKQQAGFRYSPDSYMQHELEASFLYEDTPDQAKATLDVKRDMESPQPMDRLICGDVGFGKTEIAMRAAFKAATDGKQVAVLVPTTVLALQHYNTMVERYKNFPVTVEYLTRGKTAAETKDVLARLKAGKIDILVGTHKLVGKTVEWHDLGLLIIDEEQKFGVAVKEKIKSLRANIDVLTLTATPIPRTLQFSLLGARDLSVMTTPPPNRYPVQTEQLTLDDEDILQEAIELELGRNGQVFVVNNRIDMLPRIEQRIKRLCPTARIVTAHGQMPPEEMEKRLEDFINYDYDILVSTTIIESGVDIPNVNTIIIFSAQHYGLADLHQLRGRVGRSNRKAYCYLVTPEKELLTADARRRLDALEVFSDLGAGFNLAMQDLDIRGAGNMLGAEQSGFIADLGYETYQRILNEAVEELRDELLPEEGEQSAPAEGKQERQWVADTQVETDLSVAFPSSYIENISERIMLYRELDSLHCEEQLTAFQKRLIDRFGALPAEAEELLNVVRLRWLCGRLGIEKVFLKKERLVLYFPTKNDAYYQSDTFGKVIRYICSKSERCSLHEDVDKQGKPTGKRYAVIMQVRTVSGAMNLLSKVEQGV